MYETVTLTVTQDMVDRWHNTRKYNGWCPLAQAAEVAGYRVELMPNAFVPRIHCYEGYLEAVRPKALRSFIEAVDTVYPTYPSDVTTPRVFEFVLHPYPYTQEIS